MTQERGHKPSTRFLLAAFLGFLLLCLILLLQFGVDFDQLLEHGIGYRIDVFGWSLLIWFIGLDMALRRRGSQLFTWPRHFKDPQTPLSYKVHQAIIAFELGVLLLLMLVNSRYWGIGLLVLALHLGYFYPGFDKVVRRNIAKEVGEQEAQRTVRSASDYVWYFNAVYLLVPLFFLVELGLG